MADWQKGDLALCVKKTDPGNPLRVGAVYTVERISAQGNLHLRGVAENGLGAFKRDRFRKVTPPKADEFDREVIELMNGQPAEYRGKSPMRTSWWEAVS